MTPRTAIDALDVDTRLEETMTFVILPWRTSCDRCMCLEETG